MCQFFTAIINLYGLFWDCGPFIRRNLLSNRNGILLPRDSKNQLTNQAMDMSNKCEQLFTWVESIRHMTCHNNSLHFYSGEKNVLSAANFFNAVSPGALTRIMGGWSISEETDWEKCLNALHSQTAIVEGALRHTLKRLGELKAETRKHIVKSWIEDGICCWYCTLEKEMRGHIEEYKNIYDRESGARQKEKLSRWLQMHFNAGGVEDWLNLQNLCNLLNSKGCPKPAFPIAVFDALTVDIKRFVMAGKAAY